MNTNYIHKTLTFDDDKQYIVINQAIYHGKNYLLLVGITPDGEDVNDDVDIVEEQKEGEKLFFASVEDPELFDLLAKYLQLLGVTYGK